MEKGLVTLSPNLPGWHDIPLREMVKERGGEGHRAARAKAFFEALQTLDSKRLSDPGMLPERVSVFGISALPRLHMEALSAIAQWTEVNLFLMNPCREYWGDILSDREMMRARSRVVHEHDLHMEKGNSLLASLGTLGREFFDLINEFPSEDVPSFEDPGTDSLLCRIQADILNLREGQINLQEIRAGIPEKRAIAAHDRSIRIHSCHSPFRETEVLQDHLLHLFEQDPELMPGDILVMTPDIEAYAPIIQAVFDLPPANPKRIPFSIADRNALGEGAVIESFLALLRLQGSRFGASQVMAILESPAVHARFGLSEANLGHIRQWILETGIRWGIDQENRREMGLPPLPLRYVTGRFLVPLSSTPRTNGSVIVYSPPQTITSTAPVRAPFAFSLRMASRAPLSEAKGPSLRVRFGRALRPDQESLPSGATYSVTAPAKPLRKIEMQKQLMKNLNRPSAITPILQL